MGMGGSAGTGKVKSEINVTPLVDVVLVLLIIFLVAMPIVMKDITIDIPKKDDTVQIDVVVPDQVVVEVKDGGRLYLNSLEINRTDLAQKVRDKLDRKREKVVFVGFEDSLRYGEAVQIMDTVRGAGATTVALKMKEEEGKAPSPDAPSPSPTPPVSP
jgi:biopolymer transport protein TolR